MCPLSRRDFLACSALTGLAFIDPALAPRAAPDQGGVDPDCSKKEFKPFADLIKQTLAETGIAGISTAIIRNRRMVYAEGFGVADKRTGKPMTEKSVMSMASIAKSFASCAIRQLLEVGAIESLDDPYVKYVPYFTMEDPRYGQITLRHLLSHTSGLLPLEYVDFFNEFVPQDYDDGSAERVVRELATGATLYQDPGGPAFQYSDLGYDVLADLIRNVTGLYFEEYMRRYILQPLRMHESTFLATEIKRQRFVPAHITLADGTVGVWEHVIAYDRDHAPSSCLHTNAEEYAQWLICNMNRGTYHGKRILSEEHTAQLWETLYPWVPGEPWGYCGGGENFDFYGMLGVGYGGGQPGVQTIGVQIPELGLGVAVLGNTLGSLTDDWIPWIVGNLAFWLLDWQYTGVMPASLALASTAGAPLLQSIPARSPSSDLLNHMHLPLIAR